jgi:hypothetical protein
MFWSIPSLAESGQTGDYLNSWTGYPTYTYILLNPGKDSQDLNMALNEHDWPLRLPCLWAYESHQQFLSENVDNGLELRLAGKETDYQRSNILMADEKLYC